MRVVTVTGKLVMAGVAMAACVILAVIIAMALRWAIATAGFPVPNNPGWMEGFVCATLFWPIEKAIWAIGVNQEAPTD